MIWKISFCSPDLKTRNWWLARTQMHMQLGELQRERVTVNKMCKYVCVCASPKKSDA